MRKRSPEPLCDPGWEPAWEPELLDPEELPLPGLGTSFSTLSQSNLGSILLVEFLCPVWLFCCTLPWRGESLRDNTGDLDVVLTGTLGGTSSLSDLAQTLWLGSGMSDLGSEL